MTIARMLILAIVVTAIVTTAALTGSDMSAIVKGVAGPPEIGAAIPPVSAGDHGGGGLGLPSGAATGGLY